jgi:TRAP-type C4-dicarboxylate transport system permease small subunit
MANDSATPVWISLIDRVLLWIALIGGGATLLFMMALSSFNVVIMRKSLNAPITGAEDILTLCLIVLVALSVPFGARAGAHIEIEVFESRMSPGFAHWSMIVMKFMGAGLMAVMSYQLFHAGQKATKFGETTQQLLISFEPYYYLLSICVGLYALVLVSDIVQLLLFRKIKGLNLEGKS